MTGSRQDKLNKNAEWCKTVAMVYEKIFEMYISLSSTINENMFPKIVKESKKVMSKNDISKQVDQIQNTTKEIHKNISNAAYYFGEIHMAAHETAGKLFEESGDLKNAAEMYMHSYDYCQDKAVELFEKIAKSSDNKSE